jgi:5-methyltetrahydrofolate--homocysteine methyltransferase
MCGWADSSLYHLDGPAAIKHLDAVLTVKKLGAVQWVPGAGSAPSGCEEWDPVYEKIAASGKGMWIYLWDSPFERAVQYADRIVSRYGKDRVIFFFGDLSEEQSYRLTKLVEGKWSK